MKTISTYSVVTFGCRVNQADSLAIEDVLRAQGGVVVAPEDAEVVVVNSCSVTASADQGTRQTVRRIARSNPHVKIIVTGCYASRDPDEVSALPNVVRVIANVDKDVFAARVFTRSSDIVPIVGDRFVDGDGPCGSTLSPGVGGRTAFTLRVQTGCDELCSYCIIPKTRGRARSRPLDRVLDDVHRAMMAGYKEIVITGVHLGSYGRDLDGSVTFVTLIRRLAAFQDDVLFRISSLEPMDCTDEVVDVVASSPALAPHFHLPLQHGSDRVLRAMRRPYTADTFETIVTRIHETMPWASIGTDLIVGFPGEGDDDFDITARLIARLPLSHLHVFPYSDRPGTEASSMSGKIGGAIVRERGRQLRAVGASLASTFRRAQAGTIRRALTVDDGLSAVTDNYIKVPLQEKRTRNEWIDIEL